MGSPARSTSSATGFPFTGLAVVLLLAQAVISVVVPPNPYRSVVTVAALFGTGYCAVVLIAGSTLRLSAAEVLAFTVGLTILITSISAVLVSILGIPVTDNAITILGLPIAIAAWYQRRPRGATSASRATGARSVLDFSDYTRAEKVVAGALLAGIVLALAAFILLSAVFVPDVSSPGLAIVGPDGTPGSLPTSFGNGTAQSVELSVFGGSAGGSFALRIRLVPQNATGNGTFHVVAFGDPLRLDPFAQATSNLTLGAQATRSETLSLVIFAPGRYDVRFDLLDSNAAVLASNVLPVVVS